MSRFDMVVILGRGIQRLNEAHPLEEVTSWVLTEDLEVCDKDSAHLPVRVPVNDESDYSMVGGGEMNLEAGLELIAHDPPQIAVCAYGGRSGYLESIGGPSESEVMSDLLGSTLLLQTSRYPNLPKIMVWNRERQLPVPSNTRQELLNAFDLALEYGFTRIGIVTIGLHVPRTQTYVSKHLSVYPKYLRGGLAPIVLESEEVLLASNREKYTPRVEAMRNSKSFKRNAEREAAGIWKIVRDVYGDAKPPVISRDSIKEPVGASAS